MEEEAETCQISQEPLFVRGCAHVCVKHGSAMWSRFGLHGRGRFLLSHLDGKRKIYKETGMPKQVHSLSSQILWHPHRRSLLQQGHVSTPSCFLCTCGCQAEPIPSLAASSLGPFKAFQTGLDQEARPLSALAVQGWPFPRNSIIPSLPNRTCPDIFALNRVASRSLGLPTHVKGTAGGQKQGSQPQLQRGGKGEPSAEPRAWGCGRGAGCWSSEVCPDIPAQLLSKGVPPQLTFGFSNQD